MPKGSTTSLSSGTEPLKIAVAGLGPAGVSMAAAIDRHPHAKLAAVCDIRDDVGSFPNRRDLPRFQSIADMCAHDGVEAVYLATPTNLHCEHAIEVAANGIHVIVEKPMAVSLAEADAMIDAARTSDAVLIVGHSQSYEPPIRAMRRLIESGELGPLRAINGMYFSDWMFRPRRPEEFATELGGGVLMRQGSHHVDIVRYLGGGLLASVRGSVGSWDPDRPGIGSYSAYMEFEDSIAASIFYSGYDHFPSSELTFGIGENGKPVATRYAEARRRLLGKDDLDEEEMKNATGGSPSRQAELLAPGDNQSFFGFLIVSCERGDMRISPDGVLIYGDRDRKEVRLDDAPSGRHAVLDELLYSVRQNAPVEHGGAWGKANLEVCLAIAESSERRSEVRLCHQIALPKLAAGVMTAG